MLKATKKRLLFCLFRRKKFFFKKGLQKVRSRYAPFDIIDMKGDTRTPIFVPKSSFAHIKNIKKTEVRLRQIFIGRW